MEKRVERGARGLNDLGEDLLMQAIPSYAGFGFTDRGRDRLGYDLRKKKGESLTCGPQMSTTQGVGAG